MEGYRAPGHEHSKEEKNEDDNSKVANPERDFHAERWVRQANQRAGVFDMIKAGTFEPSPDYYMHKEADRDNADFDRRHTEEFRKWEAMTQEVIQSFIEKARNPECNKKTLVLCLGGGMKASYVAGEVFALTQMGIKPDVIVGASSGSEVATALAQGVEGVKKGINKIINGLSSEDFISFTPKRIKDNNMINLAHNEQLSNNPSSEYYIDPKAVQGSSSELHYIVTDGEGNPQFIDAKKLESPSAGIRASMTIPYVTGELTQLNGEQYYDGAINPMPVEELLERFPDVTDVLILPQTPFTRPDQLYPTAAEKVGALLAKNLNYTLLEKGFLVTEALRRNFERIHNEKHVNIGVIWPPDENLSQITIDKDKAIAALLSSARATYQKFGAEVPDDLLAELAIQ